MCSISHLQRWLTLVYSYQRPCGLFLALAKTTFFSKRHASSFLVIEVKRGYISIYWLAGASRWIVDGRSSTSTSQAQTVVLLRREKQKVFFSSSSFPASRKQVARIAQFNDALLSLCLFFSSLLYSNDLSISCERAPLRRKRNVSLLPLFCASGSTCASAHWSKSSMAQLCPLCVDGMERGFSGAAAAIRSVRHYTVRARPLLFFFWKDIFCVLLFDIYLDLSINTKTLWQN